MDYKIGFLFPADDFPSEEQFIILVHNNYHCEFKLVPSSLFPKNPTKPITVLNDDFQMERRWTKESNLDYPFIYQEREDGEIYNIRMLHDIPITSSPKEEKGFCLSKLETGTYKSDLYFNGIKVYQKIYGYTNVLFYLYVIRYYVLYRKVSYIRKNTAPLSAYFLCYKYFKPVIDYISHFDIRLALSTLRVRVYDQYKSRAGEDDSYYIIKEVSVNYSTDVDDGYLWNLIDIGEKTIYSDHGFTTSLPRLAENFIKMNPLGLYSGELLEKEKEKIISKYSKEEHFASLFMHHLTKREFTRGTVLPIWESELEKEKQNLLATFHLSTVLECWKQYRKKYSYSTIGKILPFLNSYIEDQIKKSIIAKL